MASTTPLFRFAIILIGLVIAGGLFLLIARTRLGIRIRAGESDREMIAALGVDIRKLYTTVFAIGAALAGLAGALVGTIQSVQVGMGEPVLILAFVVIIIGGLGSIVGALVSAILVGLADTLGRFLLPVAFDTFMDSSHRQQRRLGAGFHAHLHPDGAGAVPAPDRPVRHQGALMMTREAAISLLIAAGLLAAPLLGNAFDEPFVITLATKVAILGLAGTGLNIALGYGGMVSLGHAAFFGLGGYVAGILASHALNYEPLFTAPLLIEGTTQMLIIWPIAIVVSGIAALVIGALSLRTTGVFFIMITLAFAQMVYYFAISWPAYGGEDGLSIYIRNEFPGLNTLNPLHFFAICYVLLILAIGFSFLLSRSRFGLALGGARQNAQRLATVGISPFRVKLTAFVISGMMAGLAGALYADLNRFVSPSMLSWHTSGEIMVFVILGGTRRLFGPTAGAALYIVLENTLGDVSEHWLLLLGALLVALVLFARGGVIGILAGQPRHA